MSVRLLIPARLREGITEARTARILRNNLACSALTAKGFCYPALSDADHVDLILGWIEWALSMSPDGGLTQMINLRNYAESGVVVLAPSYPETTGYMLSTLIYGLRHGLKSVERHSLDKMKNYLLSVQRDDGGFAEPGKWDRALAFDTGQVLTGLVAYYRHVEGLPRIEEAITRAADWMAAQVQQSGAYAQQSSYRGSRAYYIQATIGLFHAGVALERDNWVKAAHKNAEWVYGLWSPPGWFDKISFEHGKYKNLHGIAYTLRGMIDLGYHLGEQKYIEASKACIESIMAVQATDLPVQNATPGHFSNQFKNWRRTISPTGMCQLALCALLINALQSNVELKRYGDNLINSVKRFHLRGFEEVGLNGLLPGSWPITGPYMHAILPNWPIKFFLDGLYIKQGADPLAIEG